MTAGYSAQLDSGRAWNLIDVLHLDVNISTTGSGEGLSMQAEVEEEVDC